MSKKNRDRQTTPSNSQAPDMAALRVKIASVAEPPIGHFIRHAYDENGELISNAS